jgi:Peptidase A4 family
MKQPRISENPSFADRGYHSPKNRANDRSLKSSGSVRFRGARILGVGLLTAGLGLATSQMLSPAAQAASMSVSPKPFTFQAVPDKAFGPESSANWAGWTVSGGTFSQVAGSWTEPAVSCATKTPQGASFWVGIDGLNTSTDPTIEQVGTGADCVKGKPTTYYLWYEMYPTASTVVKKPVAPGDVFTAQVSVSSTGKIFTLSISAATSGGQALWQYSIKKTVAKAPKLASAEWISEAPCAGSPCKLVPLADFGTVNFSKLSAAGKATVKKAGFTDTKLTMVNSKTNVTMAQPSALSSGGTAFSIAWLHN